MFSMSAAERNFGCFFETFLFSVSYKGYMTSKEDYLSGMRDAADLLVDEYEMCELEFEGEEQKLKTIKFAFCRALGLIEDTMIQYGAEIKFNDLINLIDKKTNDTTTES